MKPYVKILNKASRVKNAIVILSIMPNASLVVDLGSKTGESIAS